MSIEELSVLEFPAAETRTREHNSTERYVVHLTLGRTQKHILGERDGRRDGRYKYSSI